MLRLQQLLQIAWFIVAAPLVWRLSSDGIGGPTLIALVTYGSLAVGTVLLWQRRVSGLLISVIVAVVTSVAFAPWSVRNFVAFLTDHPRYVDSPATILVVGLVSVITVVPSAVVLALSAVNRRSFSTPSGA